MTKFIATILKVLNIIIVAAYLSACLIPVLPAGRFWMVAMLGLIFPVLAAVVLAFLVVWLLARSKWALLSLVALLLSWQQLSIVAGLNSNKKFNPKKPVETYEYFPGTSRAGAKPAKVLTAGYRRCRQ